MKLVVPTITASDTHQFRAQTDLVASISDFAHLDLANQDFKSAPHLIDYKKIYLEPTLTYSVHLMYLKPTDIVKYFLGLPYPPKMLILQAESDSSSLLESIKLIKDSASLLGISLLQESLVEDYSQVVSMADQVVIFSGELGRHGGSADLKLLEKVSKIKKIKQDIEIAWDGGINKENISQLAEGGIDVFYVGGRIHRSADPYQTLNNMQEIVGSSN